MKNKNTYSIYKRMRFKQACLKIRNIIISLKALNLCRVGEAKGKGGKKVKKHVNKTVCLLAWVTYRSFAI